MLCSQMLRRGMAGANLALLTAVGIAALLDQGRGMANAAVAGALVLVFFASGQGVQMIAGERADGTGLVLLLGSFLVRAAGLGVLLWIVMSHTSRVEPLLSRPCFLLGAGLCTVGWLGAVLVTGMSQRVYAYDRDYDAARSGGGSV